MTPRWKALVAGSAGVLLTFAWLIVVSAPARRAALERGRLFDPGVSAELAAVRARTIRSVRYELLFRVPEELDASVVGRAVIRFVLDEVPESLVLDFAQPSGRIRALHAAGSPAPFDVRNGHLVVPASSLRLGNNEIVVEFEAGDEALNRNADYLYSLFVPARARLAFPCFDQPDLKARYSLTLEVPPAWEVVANGAELDRRTVNGRTSVRFAETAPLPTYLFAFAAGRFQIERAERGGRIFRMFHRETDAGRLARNREALFDLHASALAWLEDYTSVPYPFGKFDFVLVPSFQFSGMEHAGAILYNASSLLLDDTATQAEQLARASTISHEAAHMWFGNLVTMRWFDDVWMKEVFANFFAAKIVNPSFPELNHDLRFLMAHHPAAYDVDRTAGANPIRQRLDNLRDAGSLYGAIIYQKAPIVMRQLEALMGEAAFQDGLREYLERYAFANATWPDLIRLLDDRTPVDLAVWSRAWVEEAGRPTIRTEIRVDGDRLGALRFVQDDPGQRGLVWNQQLQVVLAAGSQLVRVPLALDRPETDIAAAVGLPAPRFVLPNGGGLGYGLFELDPDSRMALLSELPDVPDALVRGSAWVTLWDELLEGRLTPVDFIDLGLRALPAERDELNVQRILSCLSAAFWRFVPGDVRDQLASQLEATLRTQLAQADTTSLKAAYLAALRSVSLTPDAVAYLERVWRRQESLPGLTLAESDESSLALALAVRGVPAWRDILREQLARIDNPDRRDRFTFLLPSVSADADERDRFFASLADRANRRHEPWVLDAVSYLHHPLRADDSRRYLLPSLDLLQDIQQTGDIFFPKRWLDATLGGHRSPAAAALVRDFLEARPDYPDQLRRLVLQSADLLFRASAM